MKKTALWIGAIALSTLFSSCDSVERDAQHVADLTCKAQKSAVGLITGEASADDVRKLRDEAKKIKADMEGKYSDPEDRKKFAKLLLEKMADCE